MAGGCPRRASGPSVPLSADTASPRPPPPLWPGGTSPARGEKGTRAPAEAPGLPGPPGSVSPLRELPRAASGLRVSLPLGCRGLGMVSRHAAGARGGGGWGGVASSGPPSFAVPPSAAVFPGARPARPPTLRRLTPAVPFPPCVRGPCPASRRAPPPPRGSRPVGTGGSRPGPSPRARPRPGDACPGGDPRDAAASARRCALSPRAAAVPRFAPRRSRREGVVGGGGGGAEGMSGGGARCVRRPFGLRRPCVPRPFFPPAPRPPRRRPPPRPSRGRRLVLPAPPRLGVSLSVRRPRPLPPPPPPPPPPPGGATGRRWSVGCCVGAWARGGPGGRSAAGLSVPLLGTLLAGALAARARARALRDATSDQTWRPAEFKHISQRRKRN